MSSVEFDNRVLDTDVTGWSPHSLRVCLCKDLDALPSPIDISKWISASPNPQLLQMIQYDYRLYFPSSIHPSRTITGANGNEMKEPSNVVS